MSNIPEKQYAIQLIGPDRLILNRDKKVFKPGPYQILCRVEAVGLCFSDLKLLKQFSSHVRKSEIVTGIDQRVLKEIPSYVPGDKPTVPGHETVVRIEEVGPSIRNFKPGQRYLVQTDYRWLQTASSNSAFGYNFEGALQEYVLMDERIITSPDRESMLLPVDDELSSSAIALVEPWACVEDAYASSERTNIKTNGQILVVTDSAVPDYTLNNFLNRYGRSAKTTLVSLSEAMANTNIEINKALNLSELSDYNYDDVVYFGSNAEVVEALFSKIAAHGILNIVLCGGRFSRDVIALVGRVHYSGIRIIGTTGCDPMESFDVIAKTGEIRDGDKINVVGAAGPMGMMHVIRNICQGADDISVFAGDIDDNRLEELTKIAKPLARLRRVEFRTYNPNKENITETFDYIVLMTPVADLVSSSVHKAAEGGIINIFAGIPETVTAKIDLNTYIRKGLYFIGTSGSTLNDMKIMLEKAQSGILDTNVSVAAISGLEGAVEGIRAVEKRTIPGKIIVYPSCKGLELIRLEELSKKLSAVAELLCNGLWTKKAERKLLEEFKNI
jgi:threonine dehydrogenase-like Zn-dependent dehydrogenase